MISRRGIWRQYSPIFCTARVTARCYEFIPHCNGQPQLLYKCSDTILLQALLHRRTSGDFKYSFNFRYEQRNVRINSLHPHSGVAAADIEMVPSVARSLMNLRAFLVTVVGLGFGLYGLCSPHIIFQSHTIYIMHICSLTWCESCVIILGASLLFVLAPTSWYRLLVSTRAC